MIHHPWCLLRPRITDVNESVPTFLSFRLEDVSHFGAVWKPTLQHATTPAPHAKNSIFSYCTNNTSSNNHASTTRCDGMSYTGGCTPLVLSVGGGGKGGYIQHIDDFVGSNTPCWNRSVPTRRGVSCATCVFQHRHAWRRQRYEEGCKTP